MPKYSLLVITRDDGGAGAVERAVAPFLWVNAPGRSTRGHVFRDVTRNADELAVSIGDSYGGVELLRRRGWSDLTRDTALPNIFNEAVRGGYNRFIFNDRAYQFASVITKTIGRYRIGGAYSARLNAVFDTVTADEIDVDYIASANENNRGQWIANTQAYFGWTYDRLEKAMKSYYDALANYRATTRSEPFCEFAEDLDDAIAINNLQNPYSMAPGDSRGSFLSGIDAGTVSLEVDAILFDGKWIDGRTCHPSLQEQYNAFAGGYTFQQFGWRIVSPHVTSRHCVTIVEVTDSANYSPKVHRRLDDHLLFEEV